jgi:capsular polysaccharide export protein
MSIVARLRDLRGGVTPPARLAAHSSSARPIILLQGPIGGFYGQLARQIQAKTGIPVLKIQFNLGDVLFDRCPWSERYTGRISDLEAWYTARFSDLRPRAVMGLGSQRPVHIAARKACETLGIPYYSGEEGYIRPDYITIERGMNNAASDLAKRPIPDRVAEPPPSTQSYGSNIFYTSTFGIGYQIAMAFGWPLFPHYRHHKERGLWSEGFCWIRCFVRNRRHKKREMQASTVIAETASQNYYVAALQVYDDLQLKAHGRGWTPERVISQVIPSFAKHAPKATRLVIKQHPLEAGHWDYTRLVDRIASLHGVRDRVIYLRYADQFKLLHNAKGMVTINSTIGLAALTFGCPVLTFGDSLYTRDGLAQDADSVTVLDAFWSNPRPVNTELANRFRSFMIRQSQVPGDYYIPKARRAMCAGIVARILAHETGEVGQAIDVPPAVPTTATVPAQAIAVAAPQPANDISAAQSAATA